MNFFQRPRRVRLAKGNRYLLIVVNLSVAGTIGIYSSTPLDGVLLFVPQGGFEPPQADPEGKENAILFHAVVCHNNQNLSIIISNNQ
jgi:hypothetical protein